MTRINCIPAIHLSDKHLLAEYREMLRFRHAYPLKNKAAFPPTYRMGTGHVRFFYDKGWFLRKRHAQIRSEMKRRNMDANFSIDLSEWPPEAMNDWTPTARDMQVNMQRLLEKDREWYERVKL
jgi:deoxyribonuclease (pyrimidine dimer)